MTTKEYYVHPDSKPVPNMEGWYTIPGFPDYAVNRFPTDKEGEIISLRNMKRRKPFLSDGYHRCGLYLNNKCYKRFVHTLVGLTFIPIPEELKDHPERTINHIDHDRLNNSVENLEWMTRSDNTKESWENGYQDLHKTPILVFDLQEDKLYEFSSVKEANDALNIPTMTLMHSFLRDRRLTPIYDRYLVTEKSNEEYVALFNDKVSLKKRVIARKRNPENKPLLCLNIETLEVTEYPHILGAAKALGITDIGIGKNANAPVYWKKITSGKYIFGFKNDPEWHERLKDPLKLIAETAISSHSRGARRKFLNSHRFWFTKGGFKRNKGIFKGEIERYGGHVVDDIKDATMIIHGECITLNELKECREILSEAKSEDWLDSLLEIFRRPYRDKK